MGRFDKNLYVTSKNISFFSHCLRDNLVCQREGKEDMGVWEARRAREEGGQGTRLSCLLPHLNSLPFPFETWHAGQK